MPNLSLTEISVPLVLM